MKLFWINLERDKIRRKRMYWSLRQGGWENQRFIGIDVSNKRNYFFSIINPLVTASNYPGVRRMHENKPFRLTKKSELACLASWKKLISMISNYPDEWFLIMEDDLGSSLACVHDWPISLNDIVKNAPANTLLIQLAPISASVRKQLYTFWSKSDPKTWLVSKKYVKSHGNGAILLNKRALEYYLPRTFINIKIFGFNFYFLFHPWNCRPVADKWIYAALPDDSCQVLTFPLFCLEASNSNLHEDHVKKFHQPSKDQTIKIWEEENQVELIKSQQSWDGII